MKQKLIVLLLALAALAACAGCSDAEKTHENTSVDGTSAEGTHSQAELPTYVIRTPYCDLLYPERWKDAVTVTTVAGEPYTVKFVLKKDGTPLFDLMFGGEKGILLGTLIRKDGNVVLRSQSYAFDPEREDYDTCCMIQEDLNVILQHLMEETEFLIGKG